VDIILSFNKDQLNLSSSINTSLFS